MTEAWELLLRSEGWQKLAAQYAQHLAHKRGELQALAQESPDARVRAVAWEIAAIEDVLKAPERAIEDAQDEAREGVE